MPWAVAAAGVTAVGSIAAAEIGKGSISKGAGQARTDLAPFKDTGVSATTRQGDLLGLNGQQAADDAVGGFRKSPGYDFQFNEGLRAIDAGAASTGMLRSGATIKAEQAFGTGLADKDFGDYVARLNSLSTTGANAAAGQANVATGAAGAEAKFSGDEIKGVTNALTGLAGNTNAQNAFTDYFQPSGSSIYQGTTPGTAVTGSPQGQAWAGTFGI